MMAYDRDDYENLDDYEEYGEEEYEEDGEEEYEEEEGSHQQPQEQSDYLVLRERLKEKFRKDIRKESGSSNASSLGKKNSSTKDKFGSFFGPSRPVIAQRVIEESKSLLENPDLAARIIKSNNATSKSSVSSAPSGSKPRANGCTPKVTNGLKTKVQILKNTRDYSFLLSDDAQCPAPSKGHTPSNVHTPKSDPRPAKLPQRPREPPCNKGLKVPDAREERKIKPSSNGVQMKPATQKSNNVSKPNQMSMMSKTQITSNRGTGRGRPTLEKALPSKIPVATSQKKVSAPGAKSGNPHLHKPTPAKSQSSVLNQSSVQKRKIQESGKANVMRRELVSSSKSQIKPPPPKYSSRMEDERADRKSIRRDKPKRRFDDDDPDPATISSMIHQLFRYKPDKYAVDDDDDRAMEANFDEILREERQSAKIARKEDEEQLRLIEEEERRERLRKEAKRRKLSQR